MVKLTSEMKEEFSKTKIIMLATSSKKGVPNVVPIGAMFLQSDDETLWIVDNFMKKTMDNVKENPIASFNIWNLGCEKSYQVKGKITYESAGADYEKAKEMIHEKKKELPAKGLLKMKFTEIYSVTPGPTAGDLLSE